MAESKEKSKYFEAYEDYKMLSGSGPQGNEEELSATKEKRYKRKLQKAILSHQRRQVQIILKPKLQTGFKKHWPLWQLPEHSSLLCGQVSKSKFCFNASPIERWSVCQLHEWW